MAGPNYKRVASAYLINAAPKYYWAARKAIPVEPGFQVTPWNPTGLHAEVDRIFEEVRKESFSDKPSRIGAKFVCPKLDGFCNPKYRMGQGAVYEVAVSGKMFKANPEYYTEAVEAAKESNWDDVRAWANTYWKGGSYPFSEEIVVQGTVTVIKPVAQQKTAALTKTAGEVRFIKDRGGDKNEWAWGTPGPMQREIEEDFEFKSKYLKPLSICLRASLMAMGHAISAQNTFARIKSADVSPDGSLGGKGYIQKVSDIRRAYMNVVEALSAVTDTLYDEIRAPHWHPESTDGGPREREEVQNILQDVEEVREDPEGWAEAEEGEGEVPGAGPKLAHTIRVAREGTWQRKMLTDMERLMQSYPDLTFAESLYGGIGEQIAGETKITNPIIICYAWNHSLHTGDSIAFSVYYAPEKKDKAITLINKLRPRLLGIALDYGQKDAKVGVIGSEYRDDEWAMIRVNFFLYLEGGGHV